MVPSEQNSNLANVAFVVEGTASLIPYVENLKNNYILPTLEYFNGGALDDYEYENSDNTTLYSLITFMASDASPDLATTCYPVTASTKKFLSWFDKSAFLGGGAEAHSHVAEGLGTALQLFDDLALIRNPNLSIQNHCILVCNSSYYSFPALETPAYSGLLPEQLVSIMVERNINLSIISPRKIPMLYKLFELGGGDVQQVHSKNYAKDKRFLILLKGYQIPECPVNPPAIEAKFNPVGECSNSQSPSPLGSQKRPNSPTMEISFKKPCLSQAPTSISAAPNTNQPSFVNEIPIGQSNPNSPYLQNPNTSPGLSLINQPNPPNVNLIGKGSQPPMFSESFPQQVDHSLPIGHSWNQSPSFSSNPATSSILCNQLSLTPGNTAIPQNIGTRPTQLVTPPVPTNPNPVPQQPQYMFNPQQQPTTIPQRNYPVPQNKPNPMPTLANGTKHENTKATIWQGIVEFYEKPSNVSGAMSANRIINNIPCSITCNVINGEVEVNSEHWHKSIVMNIIPRQLFSIPPLSTHLKSSRQVELHFNKENDSFQSLFKILNSGFVGCIQFPQPQADIKIMIVLYLPEKRGFLGLIARDQDGFYNALRQLNENYRKQNQAKQRMGGAPPGNIRQPNNIPQQLQVGQMNSQSAPINPSQQQSARYQQLFDPERQRNLLKIQQLQQTLEAAQQRELQYKAQHEPGVVQQPSYHQIQQQQPTLDQVQQAQQSQTSANPQLRHLLQQQVQQMQQPQQILLTSGIQNIQPGCMAPGSFNSGPTSSMGGGGGGGGWDDKSLIDLLPPNP